MIERILSNLESYADQMLSQQAVEEFAHSLLVTYRRHCQRVQATEIQTSHMHTESLKELVPRLLRESAVMTELEDTKAA